MFTHAEVSINKSETTVITITVAPWEIPLLGLVHGDDRIIPTGRTVRVNREKPSAAAEYERLALKYKGNRETGGTDYVAQAYGAGPIGVRNLAREMAREYSAFEAGGETGDFGSDQSDEPADPIDEPTDPIGGLEDDPTAGLFEDAPAAAEGAQPIVE